MNRLYILAASAVLVGGYMFATTQSASANSSNSLVLVGQVDGLETDGAFRANVTFRDPVSDQIVYSGDTQVDVKNGSYKAEFPEFKGNGEKLYKVEMEGLEAAEDFEMAGFVNLQDSTPGSVQTGHINISGYVLANRIGLGVSPTIAKVQVNETGSAQGVRSITNSGTAVYGQATAGTGLAAGGYFTTSSVGGRAMVGDALSTTGSTVGGLFYNRSQAGVAIWGRHINVAGDSIGVFGQTGSPTGTGVLAENTNTGDRASLAGANGSLYTQGTLPKHEYTTGISATMVPIAYGNVGLTGTVFDIGTGNWTVTKAATGTYDIDVIGVSSFVSTYIVVANSDQNAGDEFMAWNEEPSTGDVRLLNWNVTSGALADSAFSFVIYRQSSFNPPAMERIPFGNMEEWARRDPQAFEAYSRKRVESQLKAMRAQKVNVPFDEAEPSGQISQGAIRPKR